MCAWKGGGGGGGGGEGSRTNPDESVITNYITLQARDSTLLKYISHLTHVISIL